jgi:putative membrane protein
MSDEIESVFASWSPPALLTIVLIGTACVYLRGWFTIRETRRAQFSGLRLSSFLLGIAALWLALASPLDDFADMSLSAHMIQHLFLMSVVPPLVLLGCPVVPLLRGLPAWIMRPVVAPLLRFPALRRFGLWLILPIPAWLVMNATFLGWHLPRIYDFALRHEYWHQLEHACFLASSLIFWWYIIRPWPTSKRRNGWAVLLFLISADLVNTLLSAFLAFFSYVSAFGSDSGSGHHVDCRFVRFPRASGFDHIQAAANTFRTFRIKVKRTPSLLRGHARHYPGQGSRQPVSAPRRRVCR